MRTTALAILCMACLCLTSCSDKASQSSSPPFQPPAGWLPDDDNSRGPTFRNATDSKQYLRYVVFRFNRPPHLTQKQIAEEIQSLSGVPLTLESLGAKAYFAEVAGAGEHDGHEVFRRQFFRVDKVSTTMAVIQVVSFFCPPSDAEATAQTQEIIRKGIRDARFPQ